MGPVAGASTTVGSTVEHDARKCIWFHRRSWGRHDGSIFLYVVFPHHCDSLCNGRNQCDVTQLKATLGRGNE